MAAPRRTGTRRREGFMAHESTVAVLEATISRRPDQNELIDQRPELPAEGSRCETPPWGRI